MTIHVTPWKDRMERGAIHYSLQQVSDVPILDEKVFVGLDVNGFAGPRMSHFTGHTCLKDRDTDESCGYRYSEHVGYRGFQFLTRQEWIMFQMMSNECHECV